MNTQYQPRIPVIVVDTTNDFLGVTTDNRAM